MSGAGPTATLHAAAGAPLEVTDQGKINVLLPSGITLTGDRWTSWVEAQVVETGKRYWCAHLTEKYK